MIQSPPGAASAAASCTNPGPLRRSEEHTSELQSRFDLVCRLLLEKKKSPRPEPHLYRPLVGQRLLFLRSMFHPRIRAAAKPIITNTPQDYESPTSRAEIMSDASAE